MTMKASRRSFIVDGAAALAVVLLVAFLAGIGHLAPARAASSRHVSIIVNSSVPLKRIDRATLRSIFGMNVRTWTNNDPVRVFVFPSDSEAHTLFCRDFLGLFPYQLERSWDRQLFAGVASRPTVVSSEEEMIEKVRTIPGAIGYVDERVINDVDEKRAKHDGHGLKVVR